MTGPLHIDALLNPDHLWVQYHMLQDLPDEALARWAITHCVEYPRNVVLRGVEWERVKDERGIVTGRVRPKKEEGT